MQQPLFEFSESFVDVVAPDVIAMAEDARRAFAQAVEPSLPPGTRCYWYGDDYVVDLTPEQTAREFGGGGQSPRPFIRPALLKAAHDGKEAFEEVIAE